MSGAKQHFIPQFLQKGFIFADGGKTPRCWVFPKSENPRSANIRDVSAQRHFYAVDKEPELDDKITQLESHVFSPLIERLRSGADPIVSTSAISDMISHFEIRNRHLRDNMRLLVEDVVSEVDRILDDEINLEGLLDLVQPDIFANEIKRFGLGIESVNLFIEQFASPADGSVTSSRQGVNTIMDLAEPCLKMMREGLPTTVKKAHLWLLNQHTSSPIKVNRYNALLYTVEEYTHGELPLGDSIVVFHVGGDTPFKPFLDASDELLNVILPLGSRQYLLGSSSGGSKFPSHYLAENIARCSSEYFIASQNSEDLRSLQELIGLNSRWLSSKDVKLIASTTMNSLANGISKPQAR